jgi:hypothetical protein
MPMMIMTMRRVPYGMLDIFPHCLDKPIMPPEHPRNKANYCVLTMSCVKSRPSRGDATFERLALFPAPMIGIFS